MHFLAQFEGVRANFGIEYCAYGCCGYYVVHMPIANRYILQGVACHLTHRCHDRKFLLKFDVHRKEYRKRLRMTLRGSGVSLLSYCITSNHVHLLVWADDPDSLAHFMQKLQGEFAKWYNLRKRRTGAFWNGRYHATMVESGDHLWRCMRYINLNMVRAGVVLHPREWRWCGYDEIVGQRGKYLVLDREKLLELSDAGSAMELAVNHETMVGEAIAAGRLEREPQWANSVAVGSEGFVRSVAESNVWRARLEIREACDDAWVVRDAESPYGISACSGV